MVTLVAKTYGMEANLPIETASAPIAGVQECCKAMGMGLRAVTR
jgi:hypothetical protein